MTGTVQVAVVAVVSPLEVRLKGSASDVLVQRQIQVPPVDLAVGERVLVTVVDRQVTFLGRWDAA